MASRVTGNCHARFRAGESLEITSKDYLSLFFLSFSIEALLIGFWGSAFGVLAAFGVGQLVNNLATSSFLEGLPGFTLIQFSVPSILMIIAIIMLIAFLAGTFPAKRAAKLDPITALRYE